MTAAQTSSPKRAFERVLVPVDGSEPAAAALRFGLALTGQGTALVLVHVSDRTHGLRVPLDSREIADALESRARAVLDEAVQLCRSESVEPVVEFLYDRPVAGILGAARRHACDLVILGTHARQIIPQAFLGSTTVGVLRLSEIPVLTVRAITPSRPQPFGSALVAVDDSEPSDAAVLYAAHLKESIGTQLVICSAVDVNAVFQSSAESGFDPTEVIASMNAGARSAIDHALAGASLVLPPDALELVEGEAVQAILATAERRNVDLIVVGSHGRRGLRHFVLGSVAEHVVRRSTLPVLVVRRPRASG